MGLLKLAEEMLAAVPPRIQYALTVLGFSLFSATASVCGTLIAQNWWLSTRGPAYYAGVARTVSLLDERVGKLEREQESKQKLTEELASMKLAIWNLDGKVEVLLDRPRPRRINR